VQIVEAAGPSRPAPPPCGRDVFVCRGASVRVCATDKNGCEVCSCERPGPNDRGLYDNADSWH
ncbi:MAG: hypothetical protein M3O46_21680, partial [Myxococcota bacterium]|nr:hypothetical protein [Myxococcota bacterium]